MHIEKISPGSNPPELINVIIEIPKGSNNKYELDKKSGAMFLDRVLHTSMHYPADYGHVPHTLCDDGDPIDVLVLISNPTFPGCIVEARPVGVLKMRDEKGLDDKVLAVASTDPNYYGVKDISDLPPGLLDEIGHFFEQYKALEKGKYSKVEKWYGVEEAKKVIMESIEMGKSKTSE